MILVRVQQVLSFSGIACAVVALLQRSITYCTTQLTNTIHALMLLPSQAQEAKIVELKAALEAAAAAAVVAQQDATFAFNATQAQLRAKHDEAATATQRADYNECELRRVTAEVTLLAAEPFYDTMFLLQFAAAERCRAQQTVAD
jgi:hypothetical protein